MSLTLFEIRKINLFSCPLYLSSLPSQLYTKDTSRSWKLVGSDRLTVKEPSANVILLDFISSKKWKDITDFDDHLDDISK